MDNRKIQVILLILAIFMAALGAKTLFSSVGASKPNLLGYKSTCTFSPISTLMLFWIAAALYTVRARLMLHENGMKGNHTILIALSILLFAGIAFYSYRYVTIRQGSQISQAADKQDAGDCKVPPDHRG